MAFIKRNTEQENKDNVSMKNVKVNKFLKKHLDDKEEQQSLVPKKTPGNTIELQYIKNHIYTNDEIKDFDLVEAIDDNILANKVGNIKSKLAYKFISESKNITSKYLLPGQVCLFSYNNPKTEEDLDYFDKTPLVLFFGIFRTSNNNIREIGLNLHYFPPFTRKKVLDKVYNMFKQYFNNNFNSSQHKPNNIMSYNTLRRIISKDAKIAFAVKEYIPTLRGTTYVIPTKLLPIAYYTEGHFSKATLNQIRKFWRQF